MNTKNIMIYGFAAFAAWFALKSTKTGAQASTGGIFDMLTGQRQASGAAIPQNTAKITEILDGNGSSFGNGWRYFSDGTSIDPSGNYYLNGQMVWAA